MPVYSDNFQRPNASTLGANWTSWSPGGVGLGISSDTAVPNGLSANWSGATWTANSVGNAQFSQFTIATLPSAGDWIGAVVRNTSTDNTQGYLGILFNNAGAWQLYIFRNNGSTTPPQLAEVGIASASVGDVLNITAIGSAITLSYNGVTQLSASDITWTTGSPGLVVYHNDPGTQAYSLWSGGDTAPPLVPVTLTMRRKTLPAYPPRPRQMPVPPVSSPAIPLARDASSPAITYGGFYGATPETLVSHSFSPPGGSVIVVTSFMMDSYLNDFASGYPIITDSLASHLSWNPIAVAYSNSASSESQRVAVWWAYAGGTSPGSMTVSITEETSNGQYITSINVAVDVWTGASTSAPVPVSNIVFGTTGAAASLSQSITPTVTGSALLLAGGYKASSTTSTTAGAGCYLENNSCAGGTNMGGGQVWWGTESSQPTLTTGITETLSIDSADNNPWAYVGYEIIPSASFPVIATPLVVTGPYRSQKTISVRLARRIQVAPPVPARQPPAVHAEARKKLNFWTSRRFSQQFPAQITSISPGTPLNSKHLRTGARYSSQAKKTILPRVATTTAAFPPASSRRMFLQRFFSWMQRNRPAQLAPKQVPELVHSGNAALLQTTTLTAVGASGINLESLWSAYLNAKLAADQATQLYIEMKQAGSIIGVASFFSHAYQLQLFAGDAYETWYAAWRKVNPAPPSGPPQLPPTFPVF